MQVRVASGGTSVQLINCHLKSKLLTFPGGRFSPHDEDERARYAVYALNRRAAEAGTLRAHVNAVLDGHGADRALILLGDLNDAPEAATTQLLLGPGGSEIGTAGEKLPDKGDAWRLWNLAPKIPEEMRYSRIYRGRGELIDHLLVSKALLDVVGDIRSVVDHGADRARLPSITDRPAEHQDQAASDHAPVVVTFDI